MLISQVLAIRHSCTELTSVVAQWEHYYLLRSFLIKRGRTTGRALESILYESLVTAGLRMLCNRSGT